MAQDNCKSFDKSKKIYIEGNMFPIKVGMKQVTLTDTIIDGKHYSNGTINLYDTCGLFTDDNAQVDIKKGLPRIREQWHKDDTNFEQLSAFTSKYTNEQINDESLKDFMFPIHNLPKKAKNGEAFTQMALAKKGIITPEME